MPSHFWLILAIGLAVAVLAPAAEQSITYPPTRRIDHLDDYHGTKVADPYRWLEDDVRTSKDVAEWVEAENKVTEAYLSAIPERVDREPLLAQDRAGIQLSHQLDRADRGLAVAGQNRTLDRRRTPPAR